MSRGVPIEEAKAQLKKSIKLDGIFFWINAVIAAYVLLSQNPWGFLNVGVCAFLIWCIRDKDEKLKILDEMKKRGYRAV